MTVTHAINDIWERKTEFFSVFFVVTFFTYGALYAADFLPEAPAAEAPATTTPAVVAETKEQPNEPAVVYDTTPRTLIIDALDKEVTINNPASTDINVLDNALLTGAAHYPGTANMQEDGTMLLFGHSSYLAVVHNKSFQAFNGIQKLEWGDTIRIRSGNYENIYRVDRVYEQKASAAEIEITHGDTQKLTLVTCNSFGTKDDRYIVEATLLSGYPLE